MSDNEGLALAEVVIKKQIEWEAQRREWVKTVNPIVLGIGDELREKWTEHVLSMSQEPVEIDLRKVVKKLGIGKKILDSQLVEDLRAHFEFSNGDQENPWTVGVSPEDEYVLVFS